MEVNCSFELPTEINCDKGYYLYLEIMYIYISVTLLIFGMLGNSLAIVVFVKQSSEKNSKTNTLIICLAVGDNLFLLSSIFTRLLPTVSTLWFLGQKLSWSIYFRPYATSVASMAQTFASYMVLLVTLQRYIMITRPIKYQSHLSNGRIICAVVVVALFSVGFSVVRIFELHVVTQCTNCLGSAIPVQTRTELGRALYFNIIYTIILRIIFRGMIPIIGVAVMTRKLSMV